MFITLAQRPVKEGVKESEEQRKESIEIHQGMRGDTGTSVEVQLGNPPPANPDISHKGSIENEQAFRKITSRPSRRSLSVNVKTL